VIILGIHYYVLNFQIDQGHVLTISNLQAKTLFYSYLKFVGLAYLLFFRTLAHVSPVLDFPVIIFGLCPWEAFDDRIFNWITFSLEAEVVSSVRS